MSPSTGRTAASGPDDERQQRVVHVDRHQELIARDAAHAHFDMKGGMPTFAASAKSKGQREESGRSGYQPVFSVVQTQRTAAVSLFR
jgi:hypothetical protein